MPEKGHGRNKIRMAEGMRILFQQKQYQYNRVLLMAGRGGAIRTILSPSSMDMALAGQKCAQIPQPMHRSGFL
jgi:hypothetical protein